MPHLIVEHSDDLPDGNSLVTPLFKALAECGVFQPDTITVRIYTCPVYQSGTQDKYFIHSKLYLYEGRTPEQLNTVAQALKKCFQPYSSSQINNTLHIKEMKREHYVEFK